VKRFRTPLKLKRVKSFHDDSTNNGCIACIVYVLIIYALQMVGHKVYGLIAGPAVSTCTETRLGVVLASSFSRRTPISFFRQSNILILRVAIAVDSEAQFYKKAWLVCAPFSPPFFPNRFYLKLKMLSSTVGKGFV